MAHLKPNSTTHACFVDVAKRFEVGCWMASPLSERRLDRSLIMAYTRSFSFSKASVNSAVRSSSALASRLARFVTGRERKREREKERKSGISDAGNMKKEVILSMLEMLGCNVFAWATTSCLAATPHNHTEAQPHRSTTTSKPCVLPSQYGAVQLAIQCSAATCF